MKPSYEKCNICGRLNKPNHNIMCGLKPNKQRIIWEMQQAALRRQQGASK